MRPVYKALYVCSIFQIFVGVCLLVLMLHSLCDGDQVLGWMFGMVKISSISGNCWAQASIAFGMHGYADVMNGVEQLRISRSPKPVAIPKIVSMWNVTRFIISFLWALVLIKGMVEYHGVNFQAFPAPAVGFIGMLCIEGIVARPIAIFCQRIHDDENPPRANQESEERSKLTLTQQCCRFVFFYEGILSGCSGAVYFLFPQLFLWLYGLDSFADSTAVWSLANFGVLVTAFGLYQLNAEIDSRWGHVLWWLILDIVWMIVYVQGVSSKLGYFNPLTLTGGNFWCHSAFHADSSLAVARFVFLAVKRSSLQQQKKDKAA